MRCARGPTKALPVAVVLVRCVKRHTDSPGPRTVRRPSDLWYPGMSAGAAPSSGQARSTQKADLEFRQKACLQTAVVIRLNAKPYEAPNPQRTTGRLTPCIHVATDDDDAIAQYMTAALETNDPDFFLLALGDVARAKGMAQVAKEAGLGRESLYKTLAPGAKPRFETVIKIARALGVKFTAQPA